MTQEEKKEYNDLKKLVEKANQRIIKIQKTYRLWFLGNKKII